jgi:Flp pilus assembly protein TadG
MTRGIRRKLVLAFSRSQSGAAAVEFAVVCLPMLLLALGIVEFGRALNVRNDLAYAADVAARMILIGKVEADDTDAEALAKLDPAARQAFTGGQPDLLQVSVTKETVDGTTLRVLALRYPLTLLLPGMEDSPIALDVILRVPAV